MGTPSDLTWSKFNSFYRHDQGYLLYNLLSGALIRLDQESHDRLQQIAANPALADEYADLEMLRKNKFLVEDDQAEIRKLRYHKRAHRSQFDALDISIVPTFKCNFACPYCYQDASQETVSDETLDSIYELIMEPGRTGNLNVMWLGGEPMLVFDKIRAFNRRVIDNCDLTFASSMVSNGYLLTKDRAKELRELAIRAIQITLDGPKSTHDTRRILKSGAGTFDRIAGNVEGLCEVDDAIRILLRVNVDKTNLDEFSEVLGYCKERFGDRVYVYAGFVDDFSTSCKSADSQACLLNREDKARFYVDLHKKHGIFSDVLRPRVTYYSCIARKSNSWAIGPDGGLYKCLPVVGTKELQVGNVNGFTIDNERMFYAFLTSGDYLDEPECLGCEMFPACDGGCAYFHVKKEVYGESYDACHVGKGTLRQFLDAFMEVKSKGGAG